jgi:hypothetical protein
VHETMDEPRAIAGLMAPAHYHSWSGRRAPHVARTRAQNARMLWRTARRAAALIWAALAPDHAAGEGDRDRCEGRAPRRVCDLPDGGGDGAAEGLRRDLDPATQVGGQGGRRTSASSDVSRRWASSTLTERKVTRGQSAHPQPNPASVCPFGQANRHLAPRAGHDYHRRRHRWSCLGRSCELSCPSADRGGPCPEAIWEMPVYPLLAKTVNLKGDLT